MTTLAFSSAGSTVSISSGVPATIDQSGFSALTYTKINLVSDIGMIGPERTLFTFNPVDDINTQKLKGSRNNGSVDLKGAYNLADPGQALLVAGEASSNAYALKIVLQSGTTFYGQVLVTNFKTGIGTVNQVTTFESKLEVSGALVVV